MLDAGTVKRLAAECGFELAGVARAEPLPEFELYREWVAAGMAGEMRYLAGRRGQMRADPRSLLPSARSIICVGKLYNRVWAPEEWVGIARYARGRDYHDVMRAGLRRLVERLKEAGAFDWKICVDTAPLLERAYARRAGLGWIGKNRCLIREGFGSWFVLGELLVSLELEPDAPPPDRCGKCTRCIAACPTGALMKKGDGWWLDARRCISYLTIELGGSVSGHVFGCDICQEVCPWNRR
jgi:epoxyqueuosine reductase